MRNTWLLLLALAIVVVPATAAADAGDASRPSPVRTSSTCYEVNPYDMPPVFIYECRELR